MSNPTKRKLLIVNNNLHIGGVQKSLLNLLYEIKSEYDVTLFLFANIGEYKRDVPEDITVVEAKFPLSVLGMSLAETKQRGLSYLLTRLFFVAVTRVFNSHIAISAAVLLSQRLAGYDYAISYLQPAEEKILYGGTNEFVLKNVQAKDKIAFVHCDYANYGGSAYRAKKIYRNFNKIVFCSNGCRDSFISLISAYKDKSYVVYNSHNANSITELAALNPARYDHKLYNIVLVSRLTYAKGIDTAIDVIDLYGKKYDDRIHLHIVGDGKNASDFKQLVHKLGLESMISFYGNQENPYGYIAGADLLLLTSHHEAAPMVFGEAQILNTPILTTETISADELVAKANAGWVCSNSARSIVESLHAIIADAAGGRSTMRRVLCGHSDKVGAAQFYSMLRAK